MLEHVDPGVTGELRALVSVENLRRSKASKRLLECRHTKVRCECVGKPKGEHLATGNIEDGDQKQKSVRHRDITDIRGPDLVRPLDFQARQQVRVNRRLPCRDTRARFAVERLDPHTAHEGGDMQPPDLKTLSSQLFGYAARAIERVIQMQQHGIVRSRKNSRRARAANRCDPVRIAN